MTGVSGMHSLSVCACVCACVCVNMCLYSMQSVVEIFENVYISHFTGFPLYKMCTNLFENTRTTSSQRVATHYELGDRLFSNGRNVFRAEESNVSQQALLDWGQIKFEIWHGQVWPKTSPDFHHHKSWK